jgi:hypothetical protein
VAWWAMPPRYALGPPSPQSLPIGSASPQRDRRLFRSETSTETVDKRGQACYRSRSGTCRHPGVCRQVSGLGIEEDPRSQ